MANFLGCQIYCDTGSYYDARLKFCEIQTFKYLAIFNDLMQKHNAEEHIDRIQVYPSVALCFHRRQYNSDTRQEIFVVYIELLMVINVFDC